MEAFTLSRTSPCPGVRDWQRAELNFIVSGQKCSLHSLLIRCMAPPVAMLWIATSWGRNFSARVPKVLPGLSFFPKKNLPFNEPAVAVNRADFTHLIRS